MPPSSLPSDLPPFPPLCAPDATLSPAELARYSRHLLLPDVGLVGQQRLKSAKVLVIGAGGLGSPALLYLAAAGVGTIGIVDFDVVDESNLQRQVIHRVDSVGQPKGESARAAIAALNPHVQVQLHPQRLEVENALDIIGAYDLILDGTDNFATRYLVNDACVLAGKPYVWGSIFRFEGQASVFWESAPDGRGINYRDLYPEPPPPEMAPSCSEGGVLGILCASIGAIMATEAIKLITGIGTSLLGRLAVYDALEMSYRFLPLRRDPARQPITGLIDYPQFCGLQQADTTPVAALSPTELQQWQQSGRAFQLIDIREAGERDICTIAGDIHIPQNRLLTPATLAAWRHDLPTVLYCRSGTRTRQALLALQQHGIDNACHLDGGILAWGREIDASLPAY